MYVLCIAYFVSGKYKHFMNIQLGKCDAKFARILEPVKVLMAFKMINGV